MHETMKISSSAVFSKLMLFVLKEVSASTFGVSEGNSLLSVCTVFSMRNDGPPSCQSHML